MGEPVKIGLEIHGYLNIPSQVKLFCNCSIAPAPPNTNICPVCTGQPGSKPMLPNREAIEAILKIALFLRCELNPELLWQRKHYSWPDLPNGYQKTMSGAYSKPVGLHGEFIGIGIEEIHLEEDPARWDPLTGGVDYNRSGFPLVEIVTKPDFTSAQQVREWIEHLMVALSYIKAVRSDLGVKCDVNVSIGPHFIRTEVKNVNSFSAIVDAINYEVDRQSREEAKLQTRAWDERTGTTIFMRNKESAMDYMFIPDPDLPVIHVDELLVAPLRESLPERPEEKQRKFEAQGVAKDVAAKLARNLYYANEASKDMERLKTIPAEFIANRYVNEIRGEAADRDPQSIELLDAAIRCSLIEAFYSRTITNIVFKELLSDLFHGDTQNISQTLARASISKIDENSLLPLIKEAILARPEAALDVRAGKEKALNSLVGYVLSALKKEGKSADPAEIGRMLVEHLK